MKFLVIDDEPLVRRSLARVLAQRGHSVFEAENGKVGVSIWQKEKPDLIFLDVLMPEMSGPQVLETLGETRTGKVVLMSAYAGESNHDLVARFKVDLFFPKPFNDIFDLVNMAEELLK